MQRIRKITSILCALSILIGMIVISPAALAAEDAKWVEKAPMAAARCEHGAEAINSKIYLIGGVGEQEDSVYIYDTSKDSWSTGAPMPTPRALLKVATVNDRIYAIGGISRGQLVLEVEIYNPITNSWTKGSNLPLKIAAFGCTVFDDKIYLIDGTVGASEINCLYIYDTNSGKWTDASISPAGRIQRLSAVTIGNKIYIIGGQSGGGTSNQVYIYDPTSNKWSNGPSMIQSRYSHESVVVNNTIYTFGGSKNNSRGDETFNSMEALDLSTNKLSVLLNVTETAQLSVSYDLAENAFLTWSSSNQEVAIVDANGKVTAVSKGERDISAQNAGYMEAIHSRASSSRYSRLVSLGGTPETRSERKATPYGQSGRYYVEIT